MMQPSASPMTPATLALIPTAQLILMRDTFLDVAKRGATSEANTALLVQVLHALEARA